MKKYNSIFWICLLMIFCRCSLQKEDSSSQLNLDTLLKSSRFSFSSDNEFFVTSILENDIHPQHSKLYLYDLNNLSLLDTSYIADNSVEVWLDDTISLVKMFADSSVINRVLGSRNKIGNNTIIYGNSKNSHLITLKRNDLANMADGVPLSTLFEKYEINLENQEFLFYRNDSIPPLSIPINSFYKTSHVEIEEQIVKGTVIKIPHVRTYFSSREFSVLIRLSNESEYYQFYKELFQEIQKLN